MARSRIRQQKIRIKLGIGSTAMTRRCDKCKGLIDPGEQSIIIFAGADNLFLCQYCAAEMFTSMLILNMEKGVISEHKMADTINEVYDRMYKQLSGLFTKSRLSYNIDSN